MLWEGKCEQDWEPWRNSIPDEFRKNPVSHRLWVMDPQSPSRDVYIVGTYWIQFNDFHCNPLIIYQVCVDSMNGPGNLEKMPWIFMPFNSLPIISLLVSLLHLPSTSMKQISAPFYKWDNCMPYELHSLPKKKHSKEVAGADSYLTPPGPFPTAQVPSSIQNCYICSI